MKHIPFLIFLLFFVVPGCTFLRGGSDSTQEELELSAEEGAEEFSEEGEEDEFADDFSDEDEMEEFSEGEEDEEFVDEEEDEYADEEAEFLEEEDEFADGKAKKKTGLRGFFSRLFGSSDKEEEDEEFLEEDEEFSEEDMDDEASQEEITDFFEEDEEGKSTQEESAKTVASSSEQEQTTEVDQTSETPKPRIIPLNKIISVPYRKAGYLVNAIYIARPGDTLEGISQKIYGFDQSDDLRKINPHLRSRLVKVGDKIYYNSPFRKEDSSRLLFYYQDINASSSIYNLSPGDNIRKVASQLLGHPDSWKEIWATNPELESKGEIENHINIVYWTQDVAVMPSPEPPQEDEPPIEKQVEEQPELEEKPPEEVFPPPLEDEKDKKLEEPKKDKVSGLGGMIKQKEIVLALLAIIIILIFMVRLILKRRKHRDFDYTATNIEV